MSNGMDLKEWILGFKCVLFRWTKLYKCPICDEDKLSSNSLKEEK